MPISIVENVDCLVRMKETPDKFYDLALVDPPYGINRDNQKLTICKNPKHNRKQHLIKNWDSVIPNSLYFAELFRISQNQIIWGANYFVEHLSKPSKAWIVWDKGQYGLSMSDCELAFSSFAKPTRIYKKNRFILNIEGTIHPTQKPVTLYKWLLQNYAKQGDKIFDSHLGSQSSRIAAYDLGFDFWGTELDADYFQAGCERFERHIAQGNLFTAQVAPTPIQEGLNFND